MADDSKVYDFHHLLKGNELHLAATGLITVLSSALDILSMLLLPAFLLVTLFSPDQVADLPQAGITHWAVALNMSTLLALVTSIFFARGLLSIVGSYLTVNLSERIRRTIGQRIAHRYLDCSLEKILSRPLADIITMTGAYCEIFASQVVLPTIGLISNSFFAFAILFFLGYMEPMVLTVVIPVLLATGALFLSVFRRKMGGFAQNLISSSAQYQKHVAYAFRGPREVRLLQLQNAALDRMRTALNEVASAKSAIAAVQSAPRAMGELIAVFLALAFMTYKNTEAAHSSEIVASMGIFAFAGLRLIACFSQVISHVATIRAGSHVVGILTSELHDISQVRIKPFTSTSPTAGTINTIGSFRNLRVSALTFRYQDSKTDVLSNLDFELRAGESVGIMGPSGSGKSTLADILLGLLTPTRGEIYLNEKRTTLESPEWWNIIGFVPQSPFIANDTLANNIAFGCNAEDISSERMLTAVSLSQLSDVVRELPEGLNTQIGDLGIRLSGGQRQRVAIARALYFEREIIVFDEATSALDQETEAELVSAIDSLKDRLTTIVIAHRPSTLKPCNRVLHMENGKLQPSSGI